LDLLPFLVGASPIADADLVDAEATLRDLDGNFRFETEAVFYDGDGLKDFAAKHFVASLHVAEVDVGQGVGEKSEEPVANGVPEIEDSVRAGTEEAGPVDDVGFAFDERAEQKGIVGRIVFEVGILDEDEVSCGFLYATAESGSFALVVGLEKDADLRVRGLEGGENVAGTVGGTVVDADEFEVERDC